MLRPPPPAFPRPSSLQQLHRRPSRVLVAFVLHSPRPAPLPPWPGSEHCLWFTGAPRGRSLTGAPQTGLRVGVVAGIPCHMLCALLASGRICFVLARVLLRVGGPKGGGRGGCGGDPPPGDPEFWGGLFLHIKRVTVKLTETPRRSCTQGTQGAVRTEGGGGGGRTGQTGN